ncbi:GNAT family N-acetyltransferase [Ruthenibacterium lactatiformans]|uniref:GNAT family N-acetyltransferase n=1 Tax=Ruthenibacterium lactatiformans TaxID=1550024 RepID=UPI00399F8C22
MEKLTEQNRAEVEAYISAEPEYNVFVQGDLENYGFESKTVEIFGTRAADGALCALLLRYFNNYCLCMSGTAPVEELAAFLQARGAQYLSGKEADVAALAARMPGWKLRGTNLARMDRLAGGAALPEGFSLRMLGPQDAQAVIGLEVQIDEFADSFRGVDREEKVEECRENLTRGGHAFGVYDGDRLVALAETTAENSVSAMVVGVATLPGWRGRGFARACVHAAAAHSLPPRRYLCLFYDNPAAGRIYHALGFADVGRFGMAMPE